MSLSTGLIANEAMQILQPLPQEPPSGRRLKLTAPSGRLIGGESVSGIAVKRIGECKHQQPRILCTIWWCNRLSNRPGMIHFLGTRFSGTKRVVGSSWITRLALWWCAALRGCTDDLGFEYAARSAGCSCGRHVPHSPEPECRGVGTRSQRGRHAVGVAFRCTMPDPRR